MSEHKIGVCVAGCTGDVGSLLVKEILKQDDLELRAAVARTAAGRSLGDVLSCDSALTIRPSVAEALAEDKFDVLVDYTSAHVAYANTHAAVEAGVAVVVGSSGITAAEYEMLDALARTHDVGVLHGNFAITAVLAQVFATMAVPFVDAWEIIEYAYDDKVDSISGTSRELAHRLSKRGTSRPALALDDFAGDKRSRGAVVDGVHVHAIRLPGLMFGFEVILARGDERLTIRHDSVDHATPFIAGTLLGVRKIKSLRGVHRGLDTVLDLDLS